MESISERIEDIKNQLTPSYRKHGTTFASADHKNTMKVLKNIYTLTYYLYIVVFIVDELLIFLFNLVIINVRKNH
jgi:hypothetical protein